MREGLLFFYFSFSSRQKSILPPLVIFPRRRVVISTTAEGYEGIVIKPLCHRYFAFNLVPRGRDEIKKEKSVKSEGSNPLCRVLFIILIRHWGVH